MPHYYDFEVVLREIQPLIWRRFLLRTGTSFCDLHKAIQDAFGWQSYHQWAFQLPGRWDRIIADLQGGEGRPARGKQRLSSYFSGKNTVEWCEYVYDFGDAWRHEVKLHGRIEEDDDFERRLTAGARACPPEDCGGVSGYERCVEFLETGRDPWDDPAEELASWLGGWEPEAFPFRVVQADFDQ